MVITYYADLIFGWNFLMDFLMIFLIHPNPKNNIRRIALAAVIGSCITFGDLFLGGQNRLLHMTVRLVSAGIMTCVAMRGNGIGELLCNAALLYGVSGCFYGVYSMVTALCIPNQPAVLLLTACLMIGGKCLLRFRKRREQRNQYCCTVSLKNNGRTVKKRAFYDSGNHLYEPISGKTVILITEHIAKLLQIDREMLRMVPYSSLGNSSGLMEAYHLDELIIHKDKDEVCYKDIYAAIAANAMFRQESCSIILHSDYRF